MKEKSKFYLICTTAGMLRLIHTLMLDGKFEEASNLITFVHQKLLNVEEQDYTEVLLPTGAKVKRNTGSTKKGAFVISGYGDCSDIWIYSSYGKKVYF
jgi:hypothetical protein